jgi:hypothetical protein
MKRFFTRQLTNIVFLVLIVGAALTIYLLSRSKTAVSTSGVPESSAVPSASSGNTPAPESAAPARSTLRGVPVSVFQTHLETSSLFAAEQSKKDEKAWTLTYPRDNDLVAQMRYSVNDGCISSLEITFALLQVYDGKAGSDIEKYLKEHSDTQTGETPDAVRALLGDLLPACDAESRLTAAIARYWAEEALLLKKEGSDFEDSQSGCRFVAYRIAGDGQDLLVCTITFN